MVGYLISLLDSLDRDAASSAGCTGQGKGRTGEGKRLHRLGPGKGV